MNQEIDQNPPGFDTEPVPISTYNETEQVQDDFWENGFNKEDDQVANTSENGNRSAENNSFTHGETDLNQLPAIPPVSSGQGLPYAPVDFPSPGDVWSWRVGKRVNAVGIHKDRFLILPSRLQQKKIPKSYASKNTLSRYLETNFPDMDLNAFFASFTWNIPALFQHANRVDAASLFEEPSKEVQNQDDITPQEPENGEETKKEGTSRYSQRKRKPIQTQTYESIEEKKPKGNPRGSNKKKKEKVAIEPTSKRKSARQATKQQQIGEVDLNFLEEEEEEEEPVTTRTSKRKKRRVSFATEENEEEVSIPHIYVSPMNGVLAVSHSPVDVNPEEFDSYLNSLDNLLQQQPPEISKELPVTRPENSNLNSNYEWAGIRMKLSSLLDKDFSSLFMSKEAAEIAILAGKLRKDPSLSAEETVRLKLMEEIPSFSEVFQENKNVIEEADRFFSALELNKAKVASLKYEYSELKEKLGEIQTEVESNSTAIREIDDEIAKLQARRNELSRYIGNKEKEKVDLSYGQKMVANSIPKVVEEVQGANMKKPEWELKKENALKREAEIMNKFAPLKGFYL